MAPPVTTRAQLLPFEALTWENFERLCQRLTALDGDVAYCARYGCASPHRIGCVTRSRKAARWRVKAWQGMLPLLEMDKFDDMAGRFPFAASTATMPRGRMTR